ncbi:MAG: hypothetical protein ACHQT8_06970 [Chlamydiales bacterium]
MSTPPTSSQPVIEVPPPQPLKPKTVGRFTLLDEEPIERVQDLLFSCLTTTPKSLGSKKLLSTNYKSEVLNLVATTMNVLQKEVCAFSKKCQATHNRFNKCLLEITRDLFQESNCEKIQAIFVEKGKAIFELLHNGKTGREGGLAQDLEHLHELIRKFPHKVFKDAERQKNDDGIQTIEFPDLFGGPPIKIQKQSKSTEKEFNLLKNLYSNYLDLLSGCIDHLNAVARPIYKTLGIILCFPNKLGLLEPHLSKEEKKKSD